MNFQKIVLIVALVILIILIVGIIIANIYNKSNQTWPPNMCKKGEWTCNNDMFTCYNENSVLPKGCKKPTS